MPPPAGLVPPAESANTISAAGNTPLAEAPAQTAATATDGKTTGFSSFLLALKATNPPQPGALQPQNTAVTPPTVTDAESATTLSASTTAAQPVAVLSQPVAGDDVGEDSGDSLPESGTDLPLADLEIGNLLASLDLTTSTPTAPAAVAPALPTETQTATRAAPAPDAVMSLQQPGLAGNDPNGSPTAIVWHDTADASGATADDPGSAATAPTTPGDGAESANQRGMELALPAEFRARLDTLLNATHRPAFAGSDNGFAAGGVSLFAGPTGLPTTSPGSAADQAFAHLPVLEPLNDRQALAQNLGDRLLLMADKGLQSATLKLQPEHLGPMEVRIQVDGEGTAQVLFSAHHVQTREALESTIPRLRELFADQGLNLAQANVDSGRSAFAQRDPANRPPAWQSWDSAATEHAVPVQSAWRFSPRSERRLDVLA
jgi:flagellar hook-length control protein FliK